MYYKKQLSDLPTEIIQQILFLLPPTSFAAISQTSKQLYSLADTPLLWRFHCQTEYKYWDPRHGALLNPAAPIDVVDWKDTFKRRQRQDRNVDKVLHYIINNDLRRIEKMEELLDEDFWDVKDSLLRHIDCPDEKEDYLARTFWARATLERLHRARAIRIWTHADSADLTLSHGKALEQSLAAFDMFVDGLEDADCSDASEHFDRLASLFVKRHLHYEDMTVREKALALAAFLREEGFQGVAKEEDYHNLPNNFIVRALNDPKHTALPLICVAIYCGVAFRIGIEARPSGFPMHVYAIVRSSGDCNLDGGHMFSEDTTAGQMYIDPFRTVKEVPASDLIAQLRSMGASVFASEAFLGPASTTEITLRTSRNIMHSVRLAQNRPNIDDGGVLWDQGDWPSTDVSLYASLWVSVLLQHGHQGHHRMRHYLPFLCEQFQSYYPWDASLFQDQILPLLRGLPEYNQLLEILNVVRAADRNKKPIVARQGAGKENVRYKVGQHFEHQRYRYKGVIIGWDVSCDATEEWMEQMRIHELGRGRQQSFYHVLAEDKSKRYVAEDNIHPITETPSKALMSLAGRYFKRWDKERGVFVSNIRQEYPDD